MKFAAACGRRLGAGALAIALATAAQTRGGLAQPSDCGSANSGLLDVQLSATASATRSVKVRQGDVLTFAFRGEEDVIGFVTLLAGDGSEARPLLGGPSGTTITHTANGAGDLDFRFATVGGGASAFTMTCTPASAQRSAERGNPPPGRRLSRLEAAYAGRLGIAAEDEGVQSPIDAVTLATVPLRRGNPTSPASEGARPAWHVDLPNTSAFEWEGARAGSTGPHSEQSDDGGARNLGVKLRLQPAIMVGVLAQFDPVAETRLGPSPLSERNWLAGPVAGLQLGSGTSFNARLGWGPLDAAPVPGIHSADRRMVDARLANTQTFGAWRFAPSVSYNYQQDTQHVAETGAQTTGSGRIDVRPELAYRIDMDHGMYIEPKAMVGSFWDIGGATALGPASPGHPEMRLKAETGVTIGSIDGTKVQVGGSIEEGAPSAANVWSGRLQVNVPLK